jgi:hypothetical protein
MTSSRCITALADQIEQMHDTGCVWSLRLDGCRLDGERQLVLDTHGKVMAELRRRGHRVRAGMVMDEIDGECVTLRIVTGSDWQVLEPRW